MGEVRKLWREHLKLSSDQELMEVLEGCTFMSHSPHWK